MKSYKRNLGLAICVFLLAFVKIYAQERGENEITIGYGYYSLYHMTYESFNGFATAFTLGSVQQDKVKSSGTFTLSYTNAMTRRWLLGVDIAYEKFSEEYLTGGLLFFASPATRVKTESTSITFAIENQFRYVLKEKFQMYSGIGFGYSSITEKVTGGDSSGKETQGAANFHLNLIGVRFGKQVALKLEFGIGYKGLVNGALVVRL